MSLNKIMYEYKSMHGFCCGTKLQYCVVQWYNVPCWYVASLRSISVSDQLMVRVGFFWGVCVCLILINIDITINKYVLTVL